MKDHQRPQTSAHPPNQNPPPPPPGGGRALYRVLRPPPPRPHHRLLSLYILFNLENTDPSAYVIMIRGFTKLQSPEKSIFLFRHMIKHSVRPDEFTFLRILKACSKLRALNEGEQIHAHVVKLMDGFRNIEFVENSLVYMYACCGHLGLASKVFDGMSERSAITWSLMLSGYVRCGHWEEVVGLFREKLKLSVRFNEATLISVLTACGRLCDIELGEWIYNYVFENVLMRNDRLMTSLVDVYAKCGRVDTAFEVFDKMYKRILWVQFCDLDASS